MVFSKTFPKQVKGRYYPEWEEVYLEEGEEREQEIISRKENIKLMKECIDDAKEIIKEKNLRDYQTNIIRIAIALFEKRASHEIYWKENKAKEKFDKINK